MKSIAITVFFAFVLNVLLPFFATYNFPNHSIESGTQSSSPSSLASLFGDKIIICTSDGFKLVSWEDLASGKEKPKPHPEYKCPLCYIAAKGTKHTLTDAVVALTTPPTPLYSAVIINNSRLKNITVWNGKYSRAPPLSHIA